jgi:cytochrome b pre-mRNA-processing protein 3
MEKGAGELAPRNRDALTRGTGFDKTSREDEPAPGTGHVETEARLSTRRKEDGGAMILGLFRKDTRRTLIATLYERVATASRVPGLFEALGVPDTVEGRFEALSLHVVLVLRALRGRPSPADEVANELAGAFFRDLDAVLRESGVSDGKVPKRMRTLAEAFYGRARVYDGPLDAGAEAALVEALGRNVTGPAPAGGLARYALAADRGLRAQDLDDLLTRGPRFPPPGSCAAATGGTP